MNEPLPDESMPEDIGTIDVPTVPERYIKNSNAIDSLLELLVLMANVDNERIPVTLYVNGLIVSGTIIPADEYFDRQGDRVGTGGLERYYRENAKIAREQSKSKNAPLPNYIHLELTTVSGGLTPINILDSLWRGRLASVDGWVFGTFGPIKSE